VEKVAGKATGAVGAAGARPTILEKRASDHGANASRGGGGGAEQGRPAEKTILTIMSWLTG